WPATYCAGFWHLINCPAHLGAVFDADLALGRLVPRSAHVLRRAGVVRPAHGICGRDFGLWPPHRWHYFPAVGALVAGFCPRPCCHGALELYRPAHSLPARIVIGRSLRDFIRVCRSIIQGRGGYLQRIRHQRTPCFLAVICPYLRGRCRDHLAAIFFPRRTAETLTARDENHRTAHCFYLGLRRAQRTIYGRQHPRLDGYGPRRRLHGYCHHRVIAKAHEYLAADYADHCPARFPRAEIPWLDSPGKDRQHIGGQPGAKKCPAANACPGHPPWKMLQGSMCPGDK